MKIVFNWIIIAHLVLVFGSSGCISAEPDYGLEVGKQAPEFKLKDQNGKQVSLSEILKQGDLAVVFHRSADW